MRSKAAGSVRGDTCESGNDWFADMKSRMQALIFKCRHTENHMHPSSARSSDDDAPESERAWFGSLRSRMRSLIFESGGTGLHETEVLPWELEANRQSYKPQTPVEIGTKSPAEMKQRYTLRYDTWRWLKV